MRPAADNAGMHTLLIDTAALDAEAWGQAVQGGALPRLLRALRMAHVATREPLREDAQAAWLSPAERWMRRALGLDEPEVQAHEKTQGRPEFSRPPRGASSEQPGPGGSHEQQAPWGALAAAGAGLQPGARAWALALPAHLVLGRDSLQLADPAQLALDAQHAQALLQAVLPLLQEASWDMHASHPGCWLVSHPSLEQVLTADPLRAVGRNAASWMPGGPAAAPWRRLLTEIQMVWASHPVNEARRAAGLPEVNTLWLHGCGVLPTAPSNPFLLDESERAAWREAGCAWLGALADGLPALSASRHPHSLHVLQLRSHDALRAPQACAELDEQAAGRLSAALREHAAVRLVLAGSRSWVDLELRASRSWHFWRDAAARGWLDPL